MFVGILDASQFCVKPGKFKWKKESEQFSEYFFNLLQQQYFDDNDDTYTI